MSTLAFGVSRSLPMVDISLQRHSSDSSCSSFRSLTTQLCMMLAVSIFSLKSSPINFIFPSERRRLVKRTSSSLGLSCCQSAACEGRYQLDQQPTSDQMENQYLSSAPRGRCSVTRVRATLTFSATSSSACMLSICSFWFFSNWLWQ